MERDQELLQQDLQWAVENEVVIKILKQGQNFIAHASRGRISAQYVINLGDTTGFAGAVWASIHAVRDGTEFHRVHGFTPGLNIDPREIGIE